MIVRTVLGDIAPADLGVTYAHEHLIIDSPTVASQWPHIHLPSVDEAVAEVTRCTAAGVATVVDAMPLGSGRDLGRLAEVSAASGLNIVASSGMHTPKYYVDVEWAEEDSDRLAERFISDVTVGESGIRPGVIKVATASDVASSRERTLFEAAGRAHAETGAPVLTHCEGGRGALMQLDLLVESSIPLSRVILSHTDKVADSGYHAEILSSGVNVEYDQALREHLAGTTVTAGLVAAMWEAGHGSQILLGTDGARRSLWSSLGGEPGLHWLLTGYPSVLREHGLGEEEINTMLIANPARVLAFEPV